jgi:peptidyl-prolyl cis-trans isomerase C
MKRILISTSIALLASTIAIAPAFSADAPAAAGAAAVAKVNGKSIPKSRADALIANAKTQGRPDSEDLRKQVREELITRELLAQEAQKKGFDKRVDVQLGQQQVLITSYLNDYARNHPPADEAIKRQYENFRTATGDKEYKARHILVEKEDEARDIIARLKKGEKFEELAKLSKDPGTKDKGGDLDWATPNSYVKPFAEALVKLTKGQTSEAPVQSPFGWHVIHLDDQRQFTAPSLEDVKGQIVQNLQGQIVRQHVTELRQKAKVE